MQHLQTSRLRFTLGTYVAYVICGLAFGSSVYLATPVAFLEGGLLLAAVAASSAVAWYLAQNFWVLVPLALICIVTGNFVTLVLGVLVLMISQPLYEKLIDGAYARQDRFDGVWRR